MLGWEVSVSRRRATDPPDGLPVARWRTGLFGLEWIDKLVTTHRAVDLGGDGYPLRYSMTVSTFMSAVSDGSPSYDTPQAVAADSAQPSGWSSAARLNVPALSESLSDEELFVEAWDLS